MSSFPTKLIQKVFIFSEKASLPNFFTREENIKKTTAIDLQVIIRTTTLITYRIKKRDNE